MSRHKLLAYALLWALPCQALWAHTLSATERQTVADGAQQAQTACYKQIYRDTNGYSQCLRELVEPEKRNAFRRLGMEYFGYVGAMAYVRVSQMGAEQVALEFLQKYRRTQKRLGVADQALCATVPGDCTVRIAQGKALQAAPPAAPAMGVQCLGGVCRIAPKQ
ncbi:hypothetical protein os1_14850 [Comamonadaceae bacterium OS-1]|nr:hypothetical protein os1_14850 [Comamonadaceae bacterium OS-1]